MEIFLKVLVLALAVTRTLCSIDGLSYMDPINQRALANNARRNEVGNPCHPLYWYPKAVPEHCNLKFTPPSGPMGPLNTSEPIRVPIPVPSQPIPYPVPFVPPPMPMAYPIPPYPVPPYPLPPYPFSPYSILPPPPLPPPPMPYAMPSMPTGPMLPVGGLPLPAMAPFPGVFPAQFPMPPPTAFGPQAGLVPAIRGLVSSDGGINIMPFSDAYSTMLEKHKHKMIRQHMEYVQKKYGEHKNYGRSKRKRKSRRW